MKKKLLLAIALITCAFASASAQSEDFFVPYKSTDLRLPSVPLITNDPMFSIWSPYNNLTDGTTRHWTNIEKPIDGLVRVDGTVYRFMGKQTEYVLGDYLLPMTIDEPWSAKATFTKPAAYGWFYESYNDSSWEEMPGAFGTSEDQNYINIKTRWAGENTEIYVRRYMNLTADDLKKDLCIKYSHDDTFYLYINGKLVISTGYTWNLNQVHRLTEQEKGYLKEGQNVIAVRCQNKTGGAYLDFGVYENIKTSTPTQIIAKQKSVDVLATNTYYTFECGPVELDVVFTAPMLIYDLDMISTPINYISYQVRSTDGQEHDVQFYLAATPEMAIHDPDTQSTYTNFETKNNIKYALTRNQFQKYLDRVADMVAIDWGAFYMPSINGEVTIASYNVAETEFGSQGKITTQAKVPVRLAYKRDYPVISYVHDFGKVVNASSFAMLGYDEVWDIEYFGTRYKGYWARNGKTIHTAFEEFRDNYTENMIRCREFDKRIYDDGVKSGNVHYAELLSASYRQVMAAHKLFEDNDGNLLYFSKENNSNGCVNTVDLTYPSAPLYLTYNPDLQMGMITSILEYSYTGRWTKPFAAHDLGTYPKANGQVYGGDMPLEESGNILILLAEICEQKQSTEMIDKYWNILTTWTDYLVENGQDPADQLCTDDFAGVWAHNCNLSVKAIMGIVGYSKLAKLKGLDSVAEEYLAKAKQMGAIWEGDAMDVTGDHYRIAFDRDNTWGQKYNMVWDMLWGTEIFPNNARQTEIKYYLTKQNKYGLPLDSRRDYTKSDWILWTAAMADNDATFLQLMEPVYKYVNETVSRVPLSDWYYTTGEGAFVGFRARSVIGGHWMKVFKEKVNGNISGIEDIETTKPQVQKTVTARYDVTGRKLTSPEKGVNIIVYSDGSADKELVK